MPCSHILAAAGACAVACASVTAQAPIDAAGRTASVVLFADPEREVVLGTGYVPFLVDLEIVGESSGGTATAGAVIDSGPAGDLTFEADATLTARGMPIADPGVRSSVFLTDTLTVRVAEQGPFVLSGRFDVPSGGGGASSTSVTLSVSGEGEIMAPGASGGTIVFRAATHPEGFVLTGDLAPGEYELQVEASANVATMAGDAQATAGINVLYSQACRADINADGALDLFDFLDYQRLFFDGDPLADFTGDGLFTLFDFLEFIDLFDDGCG
ncbi:MAG: GC-type dockerin domain-anchored protein [Planctomycetota bacterium]